jgi:hypothetical protein
MNGSDAGWDFATLLDELGLVVAQVEVRGIGDKREIVWNN